MHACPNMKIISICVAIAFCCSLTNAWRNPPRFRNQRPVVQNQFTQGRPPYFKDHHQNPPNHLDVALPKSVMDTDSSLWIHLKDQSLWDKENGISGHDSKAALLPSYLTSAFPGSHRSLENMEPVPDEPSSDGPANDMMQMLKSEEQMSDLQDLEEMLRDEHVAKAVAESAHKSDLYFNLKDALKNIYNNQMPSSENQGQTHRSNMMNKFGVHFDINEIEAQLKEKMQGHFDPPENEGDKSPRSHPVIPNGLFFSLIETLKDYVDEKAKNVDGNDKTVNDKNEIRDFGNESQVADDIIAAQNAWLLQQLQNNNKTAQTVNEDGGTYFSLANKDGGRP